LPAQYSPWLMLSVRESPEGGNLRLEVACQPASPPSAARELVVLVHGFNNHMGEAAEAYQGFRSRQYPWAGVMPPALEPVLGDFFWPGDADWVGLLDKADFLVYPTAVNTAPLAGQRLATYLASMPNLLSVDFVGHSLGCRVVLECMQAMLGMPAHPHVRRVVLMAAAVPDYMVAPHGSLAQAVAKAESVLVLHSTSDVVLHYAFPPGQTMAGAGEGFLPTALGRFGPPAGMPGDVLDFPIEGAGHGDYWGYRDGDMSAEQDRIRGVVAGHVAASLRLGQIARQLGVRAQAASGAPIGEAREVGKGREVGRSRGIGLT
jgi:hypothetical protein